MQRNQRLSGRSVAGLRGGPRLSALVAVLWFGCSNEAGTSLTSEADAARGADAGAQAAEAGAADWRVCREPVDARYFNLDELEGCREYTGSLHIQHVFEEVYELPQLRHLEVVRSTVNIKRNQGLIEMAGLGALRSIGKNLLISDNPRLRSLSALAALQTVLGTVQITRNPSLTRLDGLHRLHTVAENLRIASMHGLQSLHGLESLAEVGSLNISDNDSLTSLSGLDALTRVNGWLVIRRNPQLPEAEVQAFVDRLVVTGEILADSNGP